MTEQILLYDYDTIPGIPYSAYFMEESEVSPKRVFTITEKRINKTLNIVEVRVMEIGRFIEYNPKTIVKVAEFSPN